MKETHLRALFSDPKAANANPRKGIKKWESALLTQLCMGKIGSRKFLYEMRVAGIKDSAYICKEGEMTGEHVLLHCLSLKNERERLIVPLRTRCLKRILTWRPGCKAAVEMVRYTGLLKQFRGTEKEDLHRIANILK